MSYDHVNITWETRVTGVMELDEKLHFLAQEARELYLPTVVPVIDAPPTPLAFYREWIAPNKPVLVRNAFNHWPALSRWSIDSLRARIGEKIVTVAVTPTGYADAIAKNRFVMPEERRMRFAHFLDILADPTLDDGIFYVQKQNSNLTDEFRDIFADVDAEIDWASIALGRRPDAVNFWMGDGRAVTSMHKDHYENLYCVVAGEKTFVLHPPTDAPFIPYKYYKPGVYKKCGDGFEIVDCVDETDVPWICVDPLRDNSESIYGKARPITCTVKAGEMLYLPSLWFHHVRQSHGSIAVNYWYDMEYDIKFAYFEFLSKLLPSSQGTSN
ncbi:bifunctional peptidase and (3S)-lysyl hydroxylase Jmjd7-like [Oscarella lobularis]|uniref:bifunctional peptidase and (3S)-lysyl hydroxylase Jmjd7-like n=1 Tax=Oscarella lobularis TaxID=121494 RepID=UPI003313ED9E